MANRYWVGGTATWNGTAGSNWAETSGGAGGQALPTSSDDVFFDAASGSATVTISTGNTGAKSVTCTGFTGTLAGTGAISIAGSITFAAAQGVTHSGVWTVTAPATITSNGKAFGGLTINAPAGAVVLADALVVTGTLTLTAGQLDAASHNVPVTVGLFSGTGSTARQLDMGSGTWTLTGTGAIWNFTAVTNLTFNRGTAAIAVTNVTVTAKTFTGGGQTFGDLSFVGAQLGLTTIAGQNTFGAVSIDAGCEIALPAAAITTMASLSAGAAMDGNMTYIHSATRGTNALLTVTAGADLEGIALQDIAISGGGAVSVTNGANIRGNAGVTFVSGTAAIVAAVEAGFAALPDGTDIATIVNAARDSVLTAVGDLPTNGELATALEGVSVDLTPVTSAIADLPTNEELATALEGVTVDLTPVLTAIGDIDSASAGEIADAVWDEAIAAHDGSGSAGQALSAAGAAGDPLLNTVPGSYASGTAGHALGRIGSGQIATVSPVSQGGNITIRRGDDYDAADGRALDWTDAGGAWPALTDGTVTVLVGSTSFSGSVVTATGDAKKVRLELTAEQTGGLSPGIYDLVIRATVAGDAFTLVRGVASVLP